MTHKEYTRQVRIIFVWYFNHNKPECMRTIDMNNSRVNEAPWLAVNNLLKRTGLA